MKIEITVQARAEVGAHELCLGSFGLGITQKRSLDPALGYLRSVQIPPENVLDLIRELQAMQAEYERQCRLVGETKANG
jgi:hypothetical protein